jgi:hypothetical protein
MYAACLARYIHKLITPAILKEEQKLHGFSYIFLYFSDLSALSGTDMPLREIKLDNTL